MSEVVTESVGVKETIEALKAVETLGVAVAEVFKDGKVTIADLPTVANLAKNSKFIADGVEGADKIPSEVKDLSHDELVLVAGAAYALVAAIKAAGK